MAPTGLTTENSPDGALKMIHFAKGLLADVKQFNEKFHMQIQIRIGINSGNLVASRMESTGEPMQIHVSENTWAQTKDFIQFEGPVSVEVKGKGEMCCYFVKGNNPYPYKEGQRLKVIIVEENLEEERKKKQFARETMEQILEKRQFTHEGKDPDYDQLRYEALKEKYGPF